MFNLFLSLFLAASFLFTWAGIGSVVTKLNALEKYYVDNLNKLIEINNKIAQVINEQSDVMNNQADMLIYIEQGVDNLDAQLNKLWLLMPTKTELLNAMKKSKKKEVKETTNESNSKE